MSLRTPVKQLLCKMKCMTKILLRSMTVISFCLLVACNNLPQFTIPLPTVPAAATNEYIEDPVDHNFRQWARNDAIPPIYDPQFAQVDAVRLTGDELVMGVTLGGEAKAYPVTTMQFREMVNDELAGVPILVTW